MAEGHSYKVTIGGRDLRVDSDAPLTNEEAYGYAKKQYDDLEAKDVAERRKTAVTLGPEGFRQSAKEEMGERSLPERVLQGFGETMDRATYGVKGLLTDLSPEEHQRLQQNKVMAQEGGLASMAGQVGGDLALTYPVMAAGAVAAPAIATTRLGQAAGRMLPRWAQSQGVRDIATVGSSVAGGGATGYVMNPEDRGSGAAWGAVGNVVGGLPRAVRAMVGRSGEAGVAGRAAADIAGSGGRAAAETAEQLANRIEQGAAEAGRFNPPIPVTAAQASGSPALAAKELGVRAALPEEFAHQTRQQNSAIYENMRRITQGAESVEQLDAARDTLTRPMRERALEVAGSWARISDPIIEHLRTLKTSDAAGSPDVQKLIAMVEAQLNQPGGKTAGQLYELEKWLRKKLSGPNVIGDETQAAVKGAQREVMGIREVIDHAIDTASGGLWRPYKDAYAAASRAVDDAAASLEVRTAANAPGKQLVGDSPQVTGRTLATDVAEAAAGRFGPRFAPATHRDLDDLVQFVRRVEEPMRTLKLAGTGGGGSQTTMQAAQLAATLLQLVPGVGKTLASPIIAMIGAMKSAEKEALAHLLLNPEAAVAALRRSALEGQPLSKAEEVLRQIARAGGRTEVQTGAVEHVLTQTLGGK